MAEKKKPYRVVVSPPNGDRQEYTLLAIDMLDAKTQASMLYYGHCFTGQFKYMRATLQR